MLSDDITLDTSWTGKDDRSTTNVAVLGNLLKHDVQFAKDGAGNLYYFDKGTYHRNAEVLIEELYYRWLVECQKVEDFKARKAKDIAEFIAITASVLWDRPTCDYISLLNGLYNVHTQAIEPHNPDWLTTVQIPITYDANAKCPAWDAFLSEVLPINGGAQYLMEIIGIAMVPFTSLQKYIILVGSGSNGKSTYLNGLQAAVGKRNISNIALHALTNPNERFVKAGLVGKLLNVFGDLSAEKIKDASHIKVLTGEDTLTIEEKHKQAYSYMPYTRYIFSCNEVVRSDDETDGYKRRYVHIPFMQKFTVDPGKGKELSETLASPGELSGLANKVLPLIANIMENGFSITSEIAAVIDEWCAVPDTTVKWLRGNIEVSEGQAIPASKLYDLYCETCPFTAEDSRSRSKFVRFMRATFSQCEVGKVVRYKDKTVKSYWGVRIKGATTHKRLWDSAIRSVDDGTY